MKNLSFMWIELTSRCNLECVHCYANSSPYAGAQDSLSKRDYLDIIAQGAALGCRAVQFIGGEPTLTPYLHELLHAARTHHYEHVEVFTNATRLSERTIASFIEFEVAVATSFYSADPAIHDRITTRPGSYESTVTGIKRALQAGLEVRVGVIEMDENQGRVDEAVAFLRELGVKSISSDRTRGFGRGTTSIAPDDGRDDSVQELCGRCWQGSIVVKPDGSISPCIMSRAWSFGDARAGIEQAIASQAFDGFRRRVYDEVWSPPRSAEVCVPQCQPTCPPNCSPTCNPISCDPRSCWPSYKRDEAPEFT